MTGIHKRDIHSYYSTLTSDGSGAYSLANASVDVSLSDEWTHLSEIFSEFRIRGCTVRYIPKDPTQSGVVILSLEWNQDGSPSAYSSTAEHLENRPRSKLQQMCKVATYTLGTKSKDFVPVEDYTIYDYADINFFINGQGGPISSQFGYLYVTYHAEFRGID